MRQTRRGPIGADGRTRRRRVARFALRVLALLATLAAPVMTGRPAQAQEPVRPPPSDSVRADSLAVVPVEEDSARMAAGDSLVGPLSQPLEGTLQDSTVDEGYALLPALPDLPPGASATVEVDLDRDRILRSNALNLLELLEEEPGFTPLRATWFGGPLQVTAGILGPAFLTVLVNGREVTTMDGGQPDLTRFPIAYLQRVRLLRMSAGWVVEITTLARDRPDAYSRIEGGTGDPGLSRLRLVFDNGLGRNFRVAASADLVDAEGAHPSSDFDFFGLFEWVPGRGASGIAFSYESESIDRDVYSSVTMRRTELFLRGQIQLNPSLRVDAFGGQTGWKQETEGAAPETEPDDRTVVSGGLILTGDWDRVWTRAAATTWASDYHPQFQFDGDVGATLFGPLQADAGVRFAAWDGFDATELRGGLSVRLPMHLTLRALGTTGTRGVSYPTAEQVDSLNFDQLTGRIDLTLPSVNLYGLVERQNLDRQLPFRSVFDLYQAASPGPVAATAFEVGGDVPVLPLNWLVKEAAPIRLSGFWRYQSVDPLLDAIYAPNYLIRGVLGFRDEFYDGNLGIDMGFGLRYRGSMSAPSVDAATQENTALVAVPDYLFLDWNMAIRVLSVIVYFRYDNLTGISAYDLPTLDFPNTRSVFGVKWTFLN